MENTNTVSVSPAEPGDSSPAPVKGGSPKKQKGNKVLTIIGIVLCVLLLPILIINIILIVQGFDSNKSNLPNIGGYFPLMVQSGSMEPTICEGDLIFVHLIDSTDDLKVDDIITYWDNEPGGTLVTHRIAEITKDKDNKLVYRTKGDGNPIEDSRYLYPDKVVGVYVNRFAGLGRVAMFMQTIPGLIVCVVLPLLIFVVYDVIRRRRIAKSTTDETAALMAELEELKKQKAQSETSLPSEEPKTVYPGPDDESDDQKNDQ